jgi:hypothetical protein
MQPLRQWPGFEPNAADRQFQFVEIVDQCLGIAGDLDLAHNRSGRVHNAHAALFQ